MKELICRGLDGSNPLHVLAAFGLLRLGQVRDPGTTLHWIDYGGWRPVIRGHEPAVLDPNAIAHSLNDLAAAGERDVVQERRLKDLNAQRKKALDAGKKARAVAKEAAKSLAPEARRQAQQAFEHQLDRELQALDRDIATTQDVVNDALGPGVAHLGDIIGVVADIFRRKAEQASRAALAGATLGRDIAGILIADAMASQACDAVVDGKGLVQNTPLSFSNGSSGQCLLKAFRTLAGGVSPAQVTATLDGTAERYLPGATPLNWDPGDQRDYALAWASPEDKQLNPKQTYVAANALALIGLALLTACPVAKRLEPVGWGRHEGVQGFSWPLWTVPLTTPTVRALLASPPRDDRERNAMGIAAVMMAARINPTGKRNFFAPAHPI
jgi:hypothetical protein